MAAVLPHMLGVLCAHFHHFFAVVWPRIRLEMDGPQEGPRSKKSPLARNGGRALGQAEGRLIQRHAAFRRATTRGTFSCGL